MLQQAVKSIFLVVLLGILLLPLLKELFPKNKEFLYARPLDGYFQPVKSPVFSLENWWNGTYQEQAEQYVKQKLAVRPYFYRWNNQLHYVLLQEVRAKDVVLGKDGFLFEEGYILALQRDRKLGEEFISKQSKRLRMVREILNAYYNTELLALIAPNKANYYPEKIPSYFDMQKTHPSTSDLFLRYLKKNDIPLINFDAYFVAAKDTTAHPLFPKLGTHWSLYGATLATDSFLQKLAVQLDSPLPKLRLNEKFTSATPMGTDNDIALGLNLLEKLKSDTLAYFTNYLPEEWSGYRPKITFIGDSFGWSIWNSGVPQLLFDTVHTQFWYYYSHIHTLHSQELKEKDPRTFDIRPLLFEADAVVLVYNTNSISSLGNGFVEITYANLGGIMQGPTITTNPKFLVELPDAHRLGYRIRPGIGADSLLLQKRELALQKDKSYRLQGKATGMQQLQVEVVEDNNSIIQKNIAVNPASAVFQLDFTVPSDYSEAILNLKTTVSSSDTASIYDLFLLEMPTF